MFSQQNSNKLSIFSEQVLKDLNSLLDNVTPPDSKVIVFLEKNIYLALDRINILANAAIGRKNLVGFFRFQENVDCLFAHHVIYFLNPDVEKLRTFVVHLLSYTHHFPKAVPQVYFVPQKPLMIEKIIESDFKLNETFSELKIGEFDFDMISLAEDLFSMEQPLIFKHLFLDGDTTSLKWIARLLLKLQSSQFGAIPMIRGKGRNAARVVNILKRLQDEVGRDFLSNTPSEVEALYIVDRTLDLVSPLMTQLTYEGLIDEFYGISCSEVTFPFSLNESAPIGGTSSQTEVLDSFDKVFSEIRDKNFIKVGSILYQKSVWVKNHYERRKEVRQLKDLKEFMKGLPEMQDYHRMISQHTVITSEIGKITQGLEFRKKIQIEQCIVQQMNDKEVFEFIEDMVYRKDPFSHILRLLSLYSIVNGGLKSKEYDFFKESLMLSYGIPQVMNAFIIMESCGFLTKYEGKTSYPLLRKQFRTWNASLKEQQPDDIAYAYSGYASLLVRLLEKLLLSNHSESAIDNIMNLLPGEKSEIRNTVEVVGDSRAIMFFVIGGLTSAELSSLRFIQTQMANAGKYRRIIVAVTDVCSGKRLLSSIIPFDLDV
ncbi:unnamed protein product [Phytomonas sp. Hart1]|nr:unnamed protein product [Phytomonas sp. Hart1]|eukprot:CCW71013.1 unnamed protein product [Phytomonas sp. isolate Hart1]